MGKVRYKQPSPSMERFSYQAEQATNRPSIGMTSVKGEIYYLPLNLLIPYKNQARTKFDETALDNLVASVKEHGILQPLHVIPSDENEGKFEVVSGERRLKAAQELSLETVPCIILSNFKTSDDVALIENIQREDLHPIELGSAFKAYLDSRVGVTHDDLAKSIGVARSTVSQFLRYANFPGDVKEYLINNNIRGTQTLRRLLRISNEDELRSKVFGDKYKDSSQTLLKIVLRNGSPEVEVSKIDVNDESIRTQIRNIFEKLLQNF